MSVTSRYRQAWEDFWREAPDEPGAVFWDAEPALTAGVHLTLFAPLLADPALPVVDLGCGNGTQTRFLADHFRHVVGADLSPSALDHARRADPAGQAGYRLLDAGEKSETETLHAELGDTNVYVRGVLHQCEPDDRQSLVDGIATLVGERGRVFLVELAEAAGHVLKGLARSAEGRPPSSPPSSGTASRPERWPMRRCRSICARPVSMFWRAVTFRWSPRSARETARASSCRRSGSSRVRRPEPRSCRPDTASGTRRRGHRSAHPARGLRQAPVPGAAVVPLISREGA